MKILLTIFMHVLQKYENNSSLEILLHKITDITSST